MRYGLRTSEPPSRRPTRLGAGAPWARTGRQSKVRVDREAIGQCDHFFLHPSLDLGIAVIAVAAAQAIQHLDDQAADLAEFALSETAGGAGRGTQTDARSNEW